MKNLLYLIAISLFLISCNTDRNRSENTDQDAMEGTNDEMGFHEKHIGDLHNAMNVMMKGIRQNDYTGDADYDFALIKKRHHQGSVDMAKCVIDNSANQEMVAIATKIRDHQLRDIQEFDLIIQNYTDAKGNSDFSERAVSAIAPMDEMKDGETLEEAFVILMTQHHRDGIKIAEEYLKVDNTHPKMREIANEIKNQHPEEIEELQALR
jgi:uncharacterized protein (DUF305 family)